MCRHDYSRSFLAAVGVAASMMLSACTTTGGIAGSGEGMVAAGFVKRPGNTPQRQDMLRRLPPNRFLKRERGGEAIYVYSDPKGCDCLYVGSQRAWDNYRFAKRRAIAIHAPLNERSYYNAGWDWVPWGPWVANLDGTFGPGRGW